MRVAIGASALELTQGDIALQDTAAIVNAANTTLLGGGGVDGAIHRAAGPALLAHCKGLGGCKTGEAKITPGFKLKAKHVIHTVGPVYRDGKSGESKLLYSCYRQSLILARHNALKTISFPSIGTGAYRYPVNEASRIALCAVIDFLKEHETPELVRFVLFGNEALQAYQEALREIAEALD